MGILMILLSILKVIGIILLALLLLILAALLYLLFLPLHYKLSGSHTTETGWEGDMSIAGFLHFWQIKMAQFSGEYELRVYGFWGKLQVYPWKKKKKTQDEVPHAKETECVDGDSFDPEGFDESEIQEILEDKTVSASDVKRMAATVEKQSSETNAEEKNVNPQKTAKQRRNASHVKPKTKSQTRKTGFQRKWESFHKNVTAEHQKNAVLFLIKKTFWILSRIKPTVMEADLDFSLGDPALTGGATGIISLWPICYGKKCRIIPDFESDDPYIWGSISLKGIVFLWHIVYLIISVYFNKDCKKLFHL